MSDFEFPEGDFTGTLSINSIIEPDPKEYTVLRKDSLNHLKNWQEFLDHLISEKVPRFPIWATEFGATYPFENEAPIKQSLNDLKKYKLAA